MLSDYVNKPDIRDSFDPDNNIFSDDDDFSDLVDDYGFSTCGAGRLASQVKGYREAMTAIEKSCDVSIEVDELMSEYLGSVCYDVGRELEPDVSEESVDEMAEHFYNQLANAERDEKYSRVEGFWIDLHPPVYGMSKGEITGLFKQSVRLAIQDKEVNSVSRKPELE